MRLKEIRESKGISQRQAALGLNLSPTVYNRYENGLREPSNALLLVIADYFGVSVDELLGRETNDDPSNIPKTPEARIIAAGVDKMAKEDRERILKMAKLMFDSTDDYFAKGKDDYDNDNAKP